MGWPVRFAVPSTQTCLSSAVTTGLDVTFTVAAQVELLQPLLTVQVIVEIPGLNNPLASFPDPVLVVAPVIWKLIAKLALQVVDAVKGRTV